MQDYKIRIPNADISRQVQEKAFDLGYHWNGDLVGTRRILDASFLYLYSNSAFTRGGDSIYFEHHGYTEISYQDFLKLGEIDVNNCKIKIPSGNIIFDLREKLESLGIKGYGNSPAIRTYGYPYYTDLHGSGRPSLMYIRNGLSSMIGTEEYFNSRPEKELTVEQIMQLQPTINNTTTEIMSEITLKCIQEPQKAKNITVDRDYTGILTDSEDTQVDTLGEAKFFRCVNNNGVEAKYRLSLFAPITPPEPPRPAKITQEELIERLVVRGDEVVCSYNNEERKIVGAGYFDLQHDEVNCSCGIMSVNGINDLYETIAEYDELDEVESIVSDYDAPDFIKALFKKIVLTKVATLSVAICLFSTTEGESTVCRIMDELAEEVGGYGTEFFRNPNSYNNIKAWLIPKL